MDIVETEGIKEGGALLPHIKVRMLQQMAEALEDEAKGLYRRVAAFEEDEFLLLREIDGRKTEINRLSLKLEAVRSERDGLLEKLETIRREATAMREEVCDGEEEIALLVIDDAQADEVEAANCQAQNRDEKQRTSVFFHRTTLSDFAR